MSFAASLDDALSAKEFDPARILIVSLEDEKSIGDEFWDSLPVKTTVQSSTIILRLIKNESDFDYNNFVEIYGVAPHNSLFIFGSNSTSITKEWLSIPNPAEFSNYLRAQHLGPYMLNPDDQHTNDDISSRKTKISVRNSNGISSLEFDESDTIRDLKCWLDSVCGAGSSYFTPHNQQPLPDRMSMTLKEAGFVPSCLVQVGNSGPRAGEGRGPQAERGLCGKIGSFIMMVLSFVNPFAGPGDQESFWEFQPSNNPDIEEVVARRFMGIQ